MTWTEHSFSIPHPEGYTTSAILTKPTHSSSRLVILCHGFLSNKNSTTNMRLTELLLPQGIGTLRFDWHGMGETGGKFEEITVTACTNQLNHILKVMVAEGYRHLGLIGSSFGGLLGVLVGALHPELHAIGLKCPVPDFPEMLELEFGREAMERWKHTNHIPNIIGGSEPIPLKFTFYDDCSLFNAYERAHAIQSPTLIVHGDGDELVPIQQIHQLDRSLGGEKQLHLIKGANHHFARPEDFRTMTVLLAEWMTKHLIESAPTSTGSR